MAKGPRWWRTDGPGVEGGSAGPSTDWTTALSWCPPEDSPLLGGSAPDTGTEHRSFSSDQSIPAPVLIADGVSKAYRRGWRRQPLQVLTDASVTVNPGEVVGLVGENGSGKSTLMKILVGALRSDAGQLHHTSSLGYCPQEPVLYQRLTCDEHFELFALAYGLDASAANHDAEQIYNLLNFASYRDSRVEELSGGTRAKLNLGLALLPDPDLLLLDEPYAGFDWDTYLRFWDITTSRKNKGRSVLIISHFVADEERFDRIIHLEKGRTKSDDHASAR